MKLKDQVVSLEFAKELKELGIMQDSIWVWVNAPCRGKGYECRLSWNSDPYLENYSAYTVAELGEMLHGRIKTDYNSWNYLHTTKLENTNEWLIAYYDDELKGSSEADARAKMVIYLIKAGLIKVEEIGK